MRQSNGYRKIIRCKSGSIMYHPVCCCILLQALNNLFVNCKKHYSEGQTEENTLPLGVHYRAKKKKYYLVNTFSEPEEPRKLSYWELKRRQRRGQKNSAGNVKSRNA